MSRRVVVGMSGGVDSSVAALLLKEQGCDVIGVFMKNWEEQDENGVCAAQSDWQDVCAVCEMIGIPYYSVNFAQAYRERVFSYFLSEYQKGRTPNPDVLCNREIKFNAFMTFGMSLGAERIATGHFARTDDAGRLYKGLDPGKDQSYFLYMLKSSQLQKTLFPLGGMYKSQVREIARAKGLPVCNKKDSTGICFIGERDFKRFLMQYLPAMPGDMVSVEGTIVGRHDGLMYYTLGQRRGLGIGGSGDGRSWFVVAKDLAANHLIVAQGEDHPRLYACGAWGTDVTWVNEAPRESPARLTARFRYRQPDQPVTVTQTGDMSIKVMADTAQRALTPGQSIVLYEGDICLGGAVLEAAITQKDGEDGCV